LTIQGKYGKFASLTFGMKTIFPDLTPNDGYKRFILDE
jgi:hypothetical protein